MHESLPNRSSVRVSCQSGSSLPRLKKAQGTHTSKTFPPLLHCLSFSLRETFYRFTMATSVRQNLIKDLKGQTIRIRDLGNILPGWPEGLSPEVEELRNQIDVRLDTYEHIYESSFEIPYHMTRCPSYLIEI